MKTRKWTPRIEALEDRNMMSATPLSVVVPESTAGMLRPAVQKVREAAATADSHKGTIEIQSWSLGASDPSAVTRLKWEKLTVPMTEEGAAGSHALYQDITIPSVEASGPGGGKVSRHDFSLAPAAEPVTLQVKLKDVLITNLLDGSGGAAVRTGYDVAANKKL
jgi:hypothetical protein